MEEVRIEEWRMECLNCRGFNQQVFQLWRWFKKQIKVKKLVSFSLVLPSNLHLDPIPHNRPEHRFPIDRRYF